MKTQVEKDKRELAVLKKCLDLLEQEHPLIELGLDEYEELLIRGYQFLTIKPILYVLNISESDLPKSEKIVSDIRDTLSPSAMVIALSAEIEMEIAELDPEDAQAFLQDLEIDEPATAKLIHASYGLLGLQSFFTVGEDECRAWTIRRGTKAQKAAGVIHTDFEKGFIRAEVISYDDFVEFGGEQGAKEAGKNRLEGKEYIVQDGDVMHFRFNV